MMPARRLRILVRDYRGVEHAEVELRPLTIVTGRNNSGKSSLLEAIAIALSAPSLQSPVHRDVVRHVAESKGLPGYTALLRGGRVAHIHVETDGGEKLVEIADVQDDVYARCIAIIVFTRLASGLQDTLPACIAERLGGGMVPKLIGNIFAALLSHALQVAAESLSVEACGFSHVALLSSLRALSAARLSALLPPFAKGKAQRIISQLRAAIRENIAKLIDSIVATIRDGIRGIIIHTEGSIKRPYSKCAYSAIHVYADAVKPEVLADILRPFYEVVMESLFETLMELRDRAPLRFATEAYVSGALYDAVVECIRQRFEPSELLSGGLAEDACAEEASVIFAVRRAGWRIGDLSEFIWTLYRFELLREYSDMLSAYGVRDPFLRDNRVYVRVNGGLTDVALLGDGLLAIMQLYIGLAFAKKRDIPVPHPIVYLVEEPEAGLHPGYLARLAVDMVRSVAEGGNSFLVVSTHSLELIQYLLWAARDQNMLDQVNVILMREGRVAGNIDGASALTSLEELNAELRGL